MAARYGGGFSIEPHLPSSTTWVVGAAPSKSPYWQLRDNRGSDVARMLLLFGDAAHAKRAMGSFMDRSDEDLKNYVGRALYDVSLPPEASVGRIVDGTPALREWTQSVVSGSHAVLLPDLEYEGFDVVLIPKQEIKGLFAGQLVLVYEQTKVTYRNRRRMSW